MLEKKLRDWLKKEMIMSKISDQLQIKTCIYNDEKITYAFIGGLPIQYCYFIAVMLSTYTSHLIPHEDYYRIIDILYEDWKDVVDLAYIRKKHKKHIAALLIEDDMYKYTHKYEPRLRKNEQSTKIKSVLPVFALKQELNTLRHRQKNKSPDLNSLDIIRIIVQDMEGVYKSSYNNPVIL